MELYDINYSLYQEVSAGGVVLLKKNDKWFIVTIERENIRDHSLPKGHQNTDESLQDTAIREIYEETGYKAQPLGYLGSFTYSVKSSSKKTITIKTVHWFLMETEGESKRKSDNEVRKVNVTPIENEFSFLTYNNDRIFIEKARQILNDRKIV